MKDVALCLSVEVQLRLVQAKKVARGGGKGGVDENEVGAVHQTGEIAFAKAQRYIRDWYICELSVLGSVPYLRGNYQAVMKQRWQAKISSEKIWCHTKESVFSPKIY